MILYCRVFVASPVGQNAFLGTDEQLARRTEDSLPHRIGVWGFRICVLRSHSLCCSLPWETAPPAKGHFGLQDAAWEWSRGGGDGGHPKVLKRLKYFPFSSVTHSTPSQLHGKHKTFYYNGNLYANEFRIALRSRFKSLKCLGARPSDQVLNGFWYVKFLSTGLMLLMLWFSTPKQGRVNFCHSSLASTPEVAAQEESTSFRCDEQTLFIRFIYK